MIGCCSLQYSFSNKAFAVFSEKEGIFYFVIIDFQKPSWTNSLQTFIFSCLYQILFLPLILELVLSPYALRDLTGTAWRETVSVIFSFSTFLAGSLGSVTVFERVCSQKCPCMACVSENTAVVLLLSAVSRDGEGNRKTACVRLSLACVGA